MGAPAANDAELEPAPPSAPVRAGDVVRIAAAGAPPDSERRARLVAKLADLLLADIRRYPPKP